jgi:hypothetical protein
MSFSQGKITSFLHPRQWRQKDVVPEFILKASNYNVKESRNKGGFSVCVFYLCYVRKIPKNELTT